MISFAPTLDNPTLAFPGASAASSGGEDVTGWFTWTDLANLTAENNGLTAGASGNAWNKVARSVEITSTAGSYIEWEIQNTAQLATIGLMEDSEATGTSYYISTLAAKQGNTGTAIARYGFVTESSNFTSYIAGDVFRMTLGAAGAVTITKNEALVWTFTGVMTPPVAARVAVYSQNTSWPNFVMGGSGWA